MGTIEDVKLKILGFLMEAKEANAKKLEEIAECANKTFLKARQQLEKEGLIQKRYQNRKEGGLEAVYSIPQEKLQSIKIMLDKEALKKNFNKNLSNAKTPEDIEFYKKKLDELEKELKYYKRLNRIKELEQLHVLPLQAVLKKLEQMGFKWQELCPNFYVEDPEYEKITGHKPRSLGDDDKLVNIGIGDWFDSFKPEDIEIKLIPASEFTEQIGDYYRKLSKELDQPINIPCRISQLSTIPFHDWEKYVPPESLDAWILLTDEPVKSYYIIGAYKELLQLYEEQFNEEWLEWKENFELSDEDWEDVGPGVREIMIRGAGRIDLDAEITHYIFSYIAATKDDAFERLKKLLIKQGASLEEAEKWARQIIKKTKTL